MIPRITVLFVGLLAAVFVSASEALNKPAIEPVFSGTSIVQVVLSLAFVIVLIYAAAWYIRRMQLTTGGAGQSMRVISALSVGSRERVVLIQVGEEQLLLGVAPGRVNLLRQFDSAIINSQDSSLRSSFSKILGDASSKSNGESTVS
ncbi:MAG: flagellar biosynthetic protein FliO [Pseudomonadales bacterium]|nr:flagellar biosynthetic protein FliO [Pseudomonadales bacterium]